MKRFSTSLPALLALSVFSTLTGIGGDAQAHNVNEVIVPTGAVPTTLGKVNMAGVTALPLDSKGMILTNVRNTARPDDYLVALYNTATAGLGLTPVKVDVYPNVGPFYEEDGLFMKNVSTTGVLRQGSTALTWGRSSMLTFGTPVTATLDAGSSFTLYVASPSTTYNMVVTESATGKVIYDQPGFASGTFHWPVAILRSGQYTIALRPHTGTSLRATVKFTHNNASTLVTIPSGGTFAYSLAGDAFSYAKAKVRLTAGQNLKLTATRSFPVDIRLIAPDNTLVASNGNLTTGSMIVLNDAPVTGDYYLVVMKPFTSSGANYSGAGTMRFDVLP